ncbi:MAG: exo-alpha-sialidase, partial [Candidatus Zixiibacteriota bacterium]
MMRTYLTTSTATYKAGISPGIKVLKIDSGPYAGRMAILMQTSSSEIRLTYADYPYTNWSTPSVMVSDGADYTFDAVMDNSGNIFLAYTLGTGYDLVCRTLSLVSGTWTAGTLHTVYNGDDNYYPSLARETSGRLWLCWSRFSSGQYYINIKSSDDSGATWGSGASDAGETLSGGDTQAYSKCLLFGSYLFVPYTLDGTRLAYRRRHLESTSWDDEADISTGSGYDHNFDAAVSTDGRLGIVFDDGKIGFREFDGDHWGGIVVVDDAGGSFPQIKYFDNVPYLTYLREFGSGQEQILYSRRPGNSFSSPQILDPRKSTLAKVFCYNSVSGSYEDVTAEASNDTSGDVVHSNSSALLKNTDDALYLGLDA